MPKSTSTGVQEIRIGPFAGGINTYSDPAMIADDEMFDCRNFDISLDGSLVSRPPWSKLYSASTNNTTVSSSPPDSSQLIIGSGTFEGDRFIILTSTHTGAKASYIYYVDGLNAGLLAKIGDGEHSKAHRYDDFMYLVPMLGSEGLGAKYDLNAGTVTVIASMPAGYASVVYKDRLWISGRRGAATLTSRLYFSGLADFTSWPGTNFFDVNPGDGDATNELIVYQDNLIIFKDNATYVLTYDSGPTQAILTVINTDVGAMGPRCVDVYENSVFILKYNQVYEMSNYDFTRVSVKIPFEYDNTFPVAPYNVTDQAWKYPLWLRIVGDRAIVRFYNRIYVYHLRLRAWTRWESNDPNIHYIGPIMRLDNTNTDLLQGFDSYVAGSALAKNIDATGVGASGAWKMWNKIFILEDHYEDSITENGNHTPPSTAIDIDLSMITKQFNVGLSHRFKRLMHWGIDCYTGRGVTGTLFPFSVAYRVSWEQLEIHYWHELNTWAYPLTSVPSVTQTIPSGTAKQIKFIRFPKSLRFRLMQFKVDMATVGNTLDGPVYLYNITAFIAAKQIVPKAVN